MKLKCVKITSKDKSKLKEIDKVIEETWPGDTPASKLITYLKTYNLDFLAFYEQNELVGFVHISKYDDMNMFSFFIVPEKYRNGGYGGKIIEEIKKLYSDKPLVAYVLAPLGKEKEINQRRINFYKRHGFMIIGSKFKAYRKTANWMHVISTSQNINYWKVVAEIMRIWYFWYRSKKEG